MRSGLSLVPDGLLALALVFTLQGCKQTAADNYQPLKARAAMSDTAFRDLILDKLESDQTLKQAKLRVRASSRNGTVTVSGIVESERLHERAVELVKSVDPDIVLTDEIVVSLRS